MRRLEMDPSAIGGTVCSHGHFDDTSGFDVVEDPRPSFVLDGTVLVTGGGPHHRLPAGRAGPAGVDGRPVGPGHAGPDDHALVVDVRGQGLLVITGCGRAGVVNVCRWARRKAGDRPVHAVLGGFHLNGPLFEPLIPHFVGASCHSNTR